MRASFRLWGAVAALFVLMGCAWAAMFVFAGRARVETVPLVATPPAKGP
jgi:hypothetical protein